MLMPSATTILSTEATALRTQSSAAASALASTSTACDPAPQMSASEQWDRFVGATPGGDLVQTSSWSEAKRALGFETCMVTARRGGELIGGALMVIKRFGPFGVAYIARGPLLSPAHPGATAELLDDLERAARVRRVHHLIVQAPLAGDAIVAGLVARRYAADAPAVAPTATLRLDLARDLDAILAGMSASHRSQIRRGERRGVQVRLGGEGDLGLFCALHQATARRQGFKALSPAYLRHQWSALAGRAPVQLIFARHDDRPLAAIWLTAFGDTVTYRLPGWSGEGRELYPNLACHWAAICWAKAQGYRYYDLGGIERRYAELIRAGGAVPEALLRSHAAFKTKFGAELVLLPTARQLTFNPLARAVINAVHGRISRTRSFDRLVTRLRSG
jgi:lipid II:glycine glycyltransferase (peptidoglycan interpeptide bridge formation enzyme)